MKSLGLYLHIPFCRSKCLYCDFCSFPHPSTETIEQYVHRLCNDVEQYAVNCRDHTVDTVYFGGGTPTLLEAKWLCLLLETISRCYHVDPHAEITAECNPATGGKNTFLQMRQAGFNRLSIGLQSAISTELKALGRLHDFNAFQKTWAEARESGFENLSADVMSGIPFQTPDSRLETLESLCALQPEHISSYDLMIEDGTPFAHSIDSLSLPDEESTRRMYFDGIDFLKKAGWHQYEISNFAKAGYESRHNLKYWNCEEYVGFGPAAYSDFNGSRFGNSRDLSAYIKGESILAERETPSAFTRANEFVMLQMRLCRGIDIPTFDRRFGISFEQTFGTAFRKYVKYGFVQILPHGYAFTPEGMYISNSILSEILDFSVGSS